MESISKILCEELSKLNNWFEANKLSLNLGKTIFMVFSNKHVDDIYTININGISINRVYVTKFLGVLIDSKLSWMEHIRHVRNKVAKSLSIVYKAKYLLTSASLYVL